MGNCPASGSNPSSINHLRRFLESLTGYGAWEWNIASGDVQWFGTHEGSADSRHARDNDHIQSFTDILHPDDRARVWQKLNSVMARREIPYADEYRFMHPDGSVRWISGTGRFYYDETGKPVRMTGVIQDMTERKQAQEALRESEERFAKAFRTSPHPIGITEAATGRCLEVNDACLQLFDFRRAEVIGNTTLMLGIWPNQEDRARLVERLQAGRPIRNLELSFKTKMGDVRHILVSSDLAELNGTLCLITVGNDITERKQAEAKLQEGEERLTLAQAAANIGSFDWDIRAQTIVWSREMERIWGLPVGGFGGTYAHWRRQIHPDDMSEAERIVRLSLENPEISYTYEHRIIRPDGTVRWVHVNATTRRDTAGRSIRMVGVNFDVTERKETEGKLRESELRFRTMAEAVPSMLFETDAAGLNTWTSEDWCRFTGQRPEQVAGHGWVEALHPEDREANLSRWLRCMETGVSFESQQRLRRTDGSYSWVIACALPVRDEKGMICRWVGSVTNIDAIIRAEEEQARLAAIVENTSDAIIGQDLQGTITSWNRAAETLLGYKTAEVIGRPVTLLFPPDRLEDEFTILDRLRKGESIRLYETVRRRKDGRDILVSLTISPIRDKQGRIVGASKILRDITDRKQAETKLRESEARFRNVFEHAGTGIAIVDLDGHFVQCNPAFCAMLGYAKDELLRVNFLELVHVEDRDVNLAETKRLLTGELPYFEIENRYVHKKNGDPVWVRKFISLLRDDAGRPKYGLVLTTDITERRKTEQKLRQSKDHLQHWAVELEKAVNEKTAELMQSQGRLRALASELSLAEQRERQRLAAELHDHLQQLLVLGKLTIGQGKQSAVGSPGCETALNRVDDILSEALSYSRTLVTELSPPVLRHHGLAAGLTWLGTYMKKYEQTVTVKVPNGKEMRLPEDQIVLLFQSVRELLINSSKYAGTGRATVTMESVDEGLRITVSDDGAGFDLATDGTAGIPSGGLSSKFGLFSIQERMRALGGSCIIQSALGQGTTATLVVPLAGDAEDKS
ncbi:MAG: PAS domain S-box protein [Nitrospira sp.]|nr:PAS domain S-box protein [Nitrospira sp.]